MARYIWGLDPASKNDAFGIVMHELPERQGPPKLRTINALTNTSFDKIWNYLVKILFVRFPPYYIAVDYTNERTFSDWLVERYGKDRIERISFTNTSKLQLKEDGLSILNQGYKFPRPDKMTDQKAAVYVASLIQQLKNEQMLQTKSGKVTFDHPTGQHNDLAIAWELSIHGCLHFMNRSSGGPVVIGYSADEQYRLGSMTAEERSRDNVTNNIMRRMRGLGFGSTVTDVKFQE